jgi:hypothetical protein
MGIGDVASVVELQRIGGDQAQPKRRLSCAHESARSLTIS